MTTEEKKQPEEVKIGKLMKISGFKYPTLRFYTDLGLLPYKSKGEGKRLTNYYPLKETRERLEEITKLKEQRRTIREIIEYFSIVK